MTDQFLIRDVKEADYSQWKSLWDGYNKFYGRFGDTALASEITATTWARFFDAYEPVHAMVAQRADHLVGLVHCLFHRSTTSIAPVCYLQDLFVTEAGRGHGIGLALINGVYQKAQAVGVQRVYWQTHESNHTAMQLYDRVADATGFVIYRKVLPRRDETS